jgi:hypothetical protein
MVRVADMTRNAFINGDLSTVMSPRTVITWAENAEIFGDVGFAFRMTFLNKCDELERPLVAEFYQRCFGEELPEPRISATTEELDAPARLSRQAAGHLQGVVAPRQPAAAPADGAAEPLVGVRSRGGHPRCRAPVARRHRSDAPLSFKRESDTEFPRHGGDAAARQFRLDARPADHGGGDLRRHPRAHAGALRRQGRDPRLHHAAWKGGQSRERGSAAGKPPIRAASTICATSSTNRPTRRGARARNLGLMMREGLLKENIDGEALTGRTSACSGRPEQRRILMVISDGAPVDDSTLSVNPATISKAPARGDREIETRSPVELIAIGIGHDVTRYYKRAVTIVDAEQLGGAMTDKLAELFDRDGPGNRPAPRPVRQAAAGQGR